jgi:hypothetical protein
MAEADSSQKIPSRSETKALKEALSANIDSPPGSPPLSAYINRRPLDSRTEADLHSACAAIVQGYPAEPEAELNFESLHKTKGVQDAYHAPAPAIGRSQSTSYKPVSLPSTTRAHIHSTNGDARRRTLAPESGSSQDLTLASAYQRHEQQQAVAGSQEIRRHPRRVDSRSQHRSLAATALPLSSFDRPRTAPTESSDVSYATPITASTDQQFANASTTMTSAAITPAGISTRASKQFMLDPESYQAAISEADTEAAIWMQSKVEPKAKPRQSVEASQPPPSRSSTRGWSFRSELRDYVRPRTSSGSRPASRDRGDHESHSLKHSRSLRSISAQGWRSWGLQRKSSKSSLVESQSFSSGANLSKAPLESPYNDIQVVPRKEIDLNRELPPLPSIDTWQEPQPQPNPGLHIASLMRPKSKAQTRKSVARHIVQASSSESVPQAPTVDAMSFSKLPHSQNFTIVKSFDAAGGQPQDRSPLSSDVADSRCVVSNVRKSMSANSNATHYKQTARKSTGAHSKTSSSDSCFSPAHSASPGPDRSLDLNRVAEHQKSIETFQKPASHLSYQRRPSDATTAPTTRPMTRDGKALNFSRKISVDNNGRINDARIATPIEITALPPMPTPAKRHNFASLRKVLSKFDLKGGKPVNWMDKFEADGIKAGIIVHTKESPVAIIRY